MLVFVSVFVFCVFRVFIVVCCFLLVPYVMVLMFVSVFVFYVFRCVLFLFVVFCLCFCVALSSSFAVVLSCSVVLPACGTHAVESIQAHEDII